MSDLARRLLDLTVEYAQRVENESDEYTMMAPNSRPPGRSRDEIAADYAATLSKLREAEQVVP